MIAPQACVEPCSHTMCEYVEVLEVPRVPTVGARTVSLFKPQRFLLSHQGESTTNTSTREGVLARVLAS